ncbi:hypothetical protein ACQY0O_004700 [Thecaphora frezii]
MLTKLLIGAAAAASLVSGVPVERRAAAGQPDIDLVILNYALTLEHLENAFYRDSLAKYDAAAFHAAGYPKWVRERFVEIGGHEKSHVDFLTKALGDKATEECEYDFGLTGVESFVATSVLLEGISNSAYLGAAANITNPAYLTAATSILIVEARHSSWVASAVQTGDGFGKPFDTPLNFNQTYSLAAPLIVSCPSINPALAVVAFPAAKLTGDGVAEEQYLAVLSGLNTTFVPIQEGGKVTLPDELAYGRCYLVVTKGESVSDDQVVAGPIVVDVDLKAEEVDKVYAH